MNRSRHRLLRLVAVLAALMMLAAACGSDDEATETSEPATATDPTAQPTEVEPAPTATAEATGDADDVEPVVEVRESGMTVTVQPAGDVVVHTMTAPEMAFANSTHIVETENALVLIDTQFLLPNALDFRAYAESLGKPIDRVFITHEHPDHFLGAEAFADLDIYALDVVSEKIAAVGQAEVDEKQAEFGDAIASTFVVPQTVEPGEVIIDGTTFDLQRVDDAEAETQLVIAVPDAGVIAVGDIVYSGIHLILAGQPPTWIAALQDLQAQGNTIVLPGHGFPAGPDVFDANIAWLSTAGELLGTVTTAEEFKTGLVTAFPDLGMTGAIDFVTPFLFPADNGG